MVDARGRNVKKKYRKIKRKMTDENEQNERKDQRKFITEREREREREKQDSVKGVQI